MLNNLVSYKQLKRNIPYISVIDYGVKGDGKTDNTSIIENLISNGYKNLYFPNGNYLFNISITQSNIDILGESKEGTIFTPYVDENSVIELNSTNGNISNGYFSNFTIYNNSSFTNSEAITFTGTNENDRHIFKNIIIGNGFLHSISILGRAIWNLFENIWIVGSLHSGIYMPGGDTKNLNTFNNITIRDGKKYAVFFSVYEGGTDVNFTYKSNIFLNCNFENNCLDSTVANQAALYFYNIDNTSLINCYIENNKNDTSTCYGIMSNGKYTRAINIIGCLIWGQDYGVKISSLAMSGLIAGNRMANNTKDIEIGNSSKAGTGNDETNLKIGGNTLKHQVNRIADINKNSFVSTINPFSYPYRHANNTSTPDVKNCNVVMCWTTESITNFLNGIDGQIVTLRFYGSTSTKTISNGDHIKLRTSDSVVLSDGDTITFIYFDGVWAEISRSIKNDIPIPTSGNWFKGFAKVNTDGVMEVGKYIDFHLSNTGTTDYDGRITLSGDKAWDFGGSVTVSSLNSNGNIVIKNQNKLVMYNENGAVDVLNPISDSALNAQVLKIGTNNYHYLNSYASIGHRFVIGETTDNNHAIEVGTETRDNIIYTQLKPYYNIPANKSAICELGSPTRQFYNTYTDQVTVNSVHSLQNNLLLVCNPDETTQKNVLQWRTSSGNYYFNPAVTDVVRLGSSSYKWASIWCTQSSLNTASDKRLKTDIKYFTEDDRYEKMFMELKPCTFKRTDSEFGRHHTGLIAQELEETMNKYDIDYTDFGALLKIPVDKDGEELDINDKKQMERFVDYQYGIRYGELIALNIHMIQKQAKEIELLKNEINKLK